MKNRYVTLGEIEDYLPKNSSKVLQMKFSNISSVIRLVTGKHRHGKSGKGHIWKLHSTFVMQQLQDSLRMSQSVVIARK